MMSGAMVKSVTSTVTTYSSFEAYTKHSFSTMSTRKKNNKQGHLVPVRLIQNDNVFTNRHLIFSNKPVTAKGSDPKRQKQCHFSPLSLFRSTLSLPHVFHHQTIILLPISLYRGSSHKVTASFLYYPCISRAKHFNNMCQWCQQPLIINLR